MKYILCIIRMLLQRHRLLKRLRLKKRKKYFCIKKKKKHIVIPHGHSIFFTIHIWQPVLPVSYGNLNRILQAQNDTCVGMPFQKHLTQPNKPNCDVKSSSVKTILKSTTEIFMKLFRWAECICACSMRKGLSFHNEVYNIKKVVKQYIVG